MRLANLESRVFFALVLLTTVVFVWIVRSFLVPIFWAAVLATLFRPVFLRMSFGGDRRGLAAALSTLIVILVVLVPTALLTTAIYQQASELYRGLTNNEVDMGAPLALVERWMPALSGLLEEYGVGLEQLRSTIQGAASTGTSWILGKALAIGQNALRVAILFGLMLYLLFFFFRDGDRIVAGIVRAWPMGDDREYRLLTRFAEVSRATVKGTIIVATVQGTLGGIMFALVGLQAPVLWGVAMGILSLLPAVGPALVWIPAAILLFALDSVWQGVVVIIGGALVIGLVDNLLRPVLVGREAKLPDYLVLIATLGGITVFGIAGFVAGPVIAALFLVMWEMFAEEYAPLDSSVPGALANPEPPGTLGDPAPSPVPDPMEEPPA